MQKKLKLTILTPVHNEVETIEQFIENACSFLKKNKIDGELILVENGSSDKTFEKASSKMKTQKFLRVLKISGQGNKGKALKLGFLEAKGDFIVTLDADLWDADFVLKSLGNLENYDIVVGSKSLAKSKDDRPLASRLMNVGYNFIMKVLFDFQGTESHAKLSFRKEKILPLVKKCKTEDLVFDTELILRGERAGLTKLEIPTVVKETRPRRFSLKTQTYKTVKNTLILLKALGPKPNLTYLTVFSAFFIAILLRTINFESWFFFSVDEEHYAYMTRMITVDRHLPLIGGPISGTTLYMAPWFLYFNAIFFFLTENSPIMTGLVFSLIASFAVFLIYLIGKNLHSKTAGAIAALLYGSSFLMALFDRHYWNITLTPLISALTLFLLIKWLDGGKKWIWPLSLVVAFGLSTTFSVFAIFLFTLLVIIFFKKPIIKKDLLIFILVIILFHLPLALFDLRHSFFLTNGLISFLHSGSQGPSFPISVRLPLILSLALETFGKALVITKGINVSEEISICVQNVTHNKPNILAVIFAAISLLVYLIQAIKIRSGKMFLIPLLFVINLLSLVAFRSDAAERHWLPFLPALFVAVGITLALLFKKSKVLAIVLISSLIILNLVALSKSYASHGITRKIAIVNEIKKITTPNGFSVFSDGDCQKWGYRYLFTWLGHEPAESYMDGSFSWMYSQPPTPEKSQKEIRIVSPNNGPIKFTVKNKPKTKQGE